MPTQLHGCAGRLILALCTCPGCGASVKHEVETSWCITRGRMGEVSRVFRGCLMFGDCEGHIRNQVRYLGICLHPDEAGIRCFRRFRRFRRCLGGDRGAALELRTRGRRTSAFPAPRGLWHLGAARWSRPTARCTGRFRGLGRSPAPPKRPGCCALAPRCKGAALEKPKKKINAVVCEQSSQEGVRIVTRRLGTFARIWSAPSLAPRLRHCVTVRTWIWASVLHT